ncbi:MAG: SMP-30/gluconolactonase/LRE family protein [Acidobacteria bacterium]|nr:SMP-30/gluconolactonase/LRE family protein [Acidobacteriota bacterium]
MLRPQTLLGLALLAVTGCQSLGGGTTRAKFPVQPEVFLDRFKAAEGIAFNGRGELFIAADRAVWRVTPAGEVTQLAELDSNLGLAGIGDSDVLAADFGPTNVFRDGPNDDGVIWRIARDGGKTAVARGIADPNFIQVLGGGSFLVSDDGTDTIYRVDGDGEVEVWSREVAFPNGMVFSLDGATLYVAQIFSAIGPVVLDDRIWALAVENGMPAGPARLVGHTGGQGVDGLALDEVGRIYVADNGSGSVRRIDPETGEVTILAEGVANVASLVFGEGDFDPTALYATSTFRGGGKIWKIPVGVRGAPVRR